MDSLLGAGLCMCLRNLEMKSDLRKCRSCKLNELSRNIPAILAAKTDAKATIANRILQTRITWGLYSKQGGYELSVLGIETERSTRSLL